MKEQKNIFYASIGISAVTLILSIAGEWHWISLPNTVLSGHRDFCVSVCLNIFSGTIVGAILALMAYSLAKKNALVHYYCSLSSYVQHVTIWAFNRFENFNSPMKVIQNIKSDTSILSETYQEEAMYIDILKKHDSISFIKKDSRLDRLIKESLDNVNAVHTSVSKVASIKALDSAKVPKSLKLLPDREIEIVLEFNKENGPLDELKRNLKSFEKFAGVTVKNTSIAVSSDELKK